jgi:hypothetical protein
MHTRRARPLRGRVVAGVDRGSHDVVSLVALEPHIYRSGFALRVAAPRVQWHSAPELSPPLGLLPFLRFNVIADVAPEDLVRDLAEHVETRSLTRGPSQRAFSARSVFFGRSSVQASP